jgi:glycosyltransferase involved in cell wall biosynthesis
MLRATDFNAIYSVGPPMTAHLIGLLLKRRSRKPWVSDFHDPWATNPFWTHRSRIGASLVLRAEGAVIRNSDAVIGRTRGIANDLRLRYGTPKVQYVPCGYDPEEVEAAANLERRTSRADIVLTHTGSIHGRRRPDGLLEAVRRLSERRALGDRRLVLRFVGRRDPEAFASPAARRLAAAEQLELLPHVDHMQCLRLMSASDALVLLQDGAPRQVPAKTYEYLASCRPILALTTEGDTAELVRWAGGEVADPHEADGIAAAILRLIRARGGPADGGAGTKPGWLAAFSAAPIAEQVASVLDCLARRQAWQRVPPGDPSASDSRRGQNMAARGLAVGGRRPLRSER